MHSPRALTCRVVLQVLYRASRTLPCRQPGSPGAQRPAGGAYHSLRRIPKPGAPSLTFMVLCGTIQKAPASAQPDIEIVFKNEKMAFRVFTGRMGISGAYAAHAFTFGATSTKPWALSGS